jgi:hypothetical protein
MSWIAWKSYKIRAMPASTNRLMVSWKKIVKMERAPRRTSKGGIWQKMRPIKRRNCHMKTHLL